ncbi:hypothetical protein F2Q69_00022713 [Brassica cretica]|uniref:Uncharacterized protein n=1 Tax=Brassica cretica TaxID=69181 RepID=A0A8S9QFI7_BRACR|nr:hypothetical protein F2Q69_00022713 [Brassica cretica]
MFCEAREKMRMRITLKKKSDPEQFAIPCTPSQELFTFVDCSQRNSEGIVRDLEVQIGNALVPVDFHVLDIKLNWNSSLLLGRAFLSTVGAVCNLQTNQLCLTLIDPNAHYDPIPVKKPQTISGRINDPGIIAACHCGAKYETDYSASIETHSATSIDSTNRKSTDTIKEESVDTCPDDWENDYYNPTIAAYTKKNRHTDSDTAYYKSIDTEVNRAREGDYSIGSWADEHHHESFAVEIAIYAPGEDKLQDGFTDEELLNMQRRDETYQIRAEAAWERTRFSHPIDRAIRPSIDTRHPQSIGINNTTSIDNRPILKTTISVKDKFDNQYLTPDEFGIFRYPDGYAKAIYGRTRYVSREDVADILQTANGADNLFMHQRNNPEQKATKESYDTTDGHTIPIHNKDIRRLLERDSRDEPSYICLPEHASLFTQTKLVPEIYTKDKINEIFYGVCGEQEKNKEAFQMKLDDVNYPMNDSISWLTTCMEKMKQDIARIQHAADVARPPSINIRQNTSIDMHHHTSIDNQMPASVDDNPPRPHTMKSQQNFYTKEEIDYLVEGIYRALETIKERRDGRCDDIYFPMDLNISALTSKIETIQGELVEIQSYIARRPEASSSIDRCNNKSTDIHGEEISADTYATIRRHQFNLESLGERLQRMEDRIAPMKEKWCRGDEAMRDFTGTKADLQHKTRHNCLSWGLVYMVSDSSNKSGR